MTRDFTQAEKDKLLNYVQQDQDKNDGRFMGGFIDWFADGINYGGLDIADYVNNLDTYHKKLIDKEDYSSGDIESLFNAVAEVDTTYQTSFTTSCTLLETINTSIQELKALVNVNTYSPESTKLFMETSEFFEELSDVSEGIVDHYYLKYVTVNADGTLEIDWGAITSFFGREVDDIPPSEYAAMIKVTDSFMIQGPDGVYELDTEAMEKFMICAYLHEDAESYYIEGDTNIFKKATLSPVFMQLSEAMELRTNIIINQYGDTLYDLEGDDATESYLRIEAMKTSLFSSFATNLQQVNVSAICATSEEIDIIKNWNLSIDISEVEDVVIGSHYKVSIEDGVVNTFYNPASVMEVYGYHNTFDYVANEAITEVATSLYVDIDADKMFVDTLTKEIAKIAIGPVLEKIPMVGDMYGIGESVVGLGQNIAEAEAQNQAAETIITNQDVAYYADPLSIGGSVNVVNGQMQIVNQYCNEERLQEKIDTFNAATGYGVDKEQLIADYNSMLQGNEPSQALEDFAKYYNAKNGN